MKKLILSIFIVGLSLLGFAQDKVYIDENFSSFTPTGWTVDGDNSDVDANTWTGSGYPYILADSAYDVGENFISPAITIDSSLVTAAPHNYRIMFDYMIDGDDVAPKGEFIISYKHVDSADFDLVAYTYTPAFDEDSIWYVQNQSGNLDLSELDPGENDIEFQISYQTAAGDIFSMSVDNFIVQVDSAGDVGPDPTGWQALKTYQFEANVQGWTTDSNSDPGATTAWAHKKLCKVSDDTGLDQYELLKSPKIAVDDIINTDFWVDYSFYSTVSANGEGLVLKIATQDNWDADPTTWDEIDNTNNVDNSMMGTATTLKNVRKQVTVGAMNNFELSDSVQFILEFNSNVTADIYVQDVYFEQDFDETAALAETDLDDLPGLGANESVLSPLATKYLADLPEGFWKTEPAGWTMTDTVGTGLDEVISRGSLDNHTTCLVLGPQTDVNDVAVSLTTEAIAFDIPDVGGEYTLNFDWATDPDLNAGIDTNPLIDNTTFNFADIVVSISVNGGASEIIWSEDDLEDFDADTWYTASIDIASYLEAATNETGTFTINFAYTTINDGAGEFYLDNFYVVEGVNPEFNFVGTLPLSVDKANGAYSIDYTSIPITQLDDTMNFGAIIYNYGLDDFVDGQLDISVNGSSLGYETIIDNWSDGDKFWELTEFSNANPNGLPVEVDDYKVIYDLQINGEVVDPWDTKCADSIVFSVSEFIYDKVGLSYVTDYDLDNWITNEFDDDWVGIGTDETGAVGTVFEYAKEDKVASVMAYLDADSETEVYLTILELTSPNDVTGTKVFTSKRVVVEEKDASWYSFVVDMEMNDSTFYAFMINQTTDVDAGIGVTDHIHGQILRGSASDMYQNLSTIDTVGTANIALVVYNEPNVDPIITSKFANDKLVYEALADGSTVNIEIGIDATDANGDDLTWNVEVDPSWLNWMQDSILANGNLLLYGIPTSDYLGTADVLVEVIDGRGGFADYDFDVEIVSELAYFVPDYEVADFRQFTTKDDQNGSGVLADVTIQGWSNEEDSAFIAGTDEYEQDELLISVPFVIPEDATSSFNLEFDWKLANFDYFCGGIPGVLGTSNGKTGADETFNLADVSLMISKDKGKTWSEAKWKEDDSELVAPVTEGIKGGKNWAYDPLSSVDLNDLDAYTSIINIDTYKGDTIVFGFRYQGKNADAAENQFRIMDLRVLGNKKVNLSTFVRTEYLNIPAQQVDWENGLDFDYYIVNLGREIPEGSTYDIQIPEMGIFKRDTIKASMFTGGDTAMFTEKFKPDAGIDQKFSFTITLNVNESVETNETEGDTDAKESITIGNNEYATYSYTEGYGDDANTISTLGVDNGLIVKYEVLERSILDTISLSIVEAAVKFNVIVVKLDSMTATSGKPVATINDNAGVDLASVGGSAGTKVAVEADKDIVEPLMLEKGFYAILVNQVTETPITISATGNDFDALRFARGNVGKFDNEPGDGWHLDIALELEENIPPEFSIVNPNSLEDTVIYQGIDFTRTVVVTDVNSFGKIVIDSIALPYWMEIEDKGNGIAVVSGNTSLANVGTYEVLMQASDGLITADGKFQIRVLPNPVPEFLTTPPSVAYENAPFTYLAAGYDKLGDAVEINLVSDTSWFTVTGAGTDSLTLTGKPLKANVGNNVVELAINDPFGNKVHQTFDVFVYENATPVFLSKADTTIVKAGLSYEYFVVADDKNGTDGLVISADTTDGSWLKFQDNKNGRAKLYGESVGLDTITVNLTVTDLSEDSDVQAATVIVVSNLAPEFTNDTTFVASEDDNYVQVLTVEDAEDDIITFSVINLPNWCTFTVTGKGDATIQGVPVNGSEGDVKVAIQAFDGNNSEVFRNTIDLTMENDVPVIITENIDDAFVGEEYNAVIEAWDEEGAALTFNADLPTWLTLVEEGNTAKLSGTPSMDDLGAEQVSVSVSDGNSFKDQIFNLSVAGATSLSEDMMRVELYPNPTNGSFSLKNAEGANVTVISNSGQVVKQVDKAQALELIDISNLDAGTYFVRIVSQDKVLTKSLSLIK